MLALFTTDCPEYLDLLPAYKGKVGLKNENQNPRPVRTQKVIET
jgi:hypothetical protein